ncbi:DHHA2 domain-containing protein [Nonomuraea sp. NPDC048892]|uniref:DHH family phosphoesterase n=1 Tax=Nonomuraea sp. NPDC048892 TaxID=3154624 RepID=UPI0033EA701F
MNRYVFAYVNPDTDGVCCAIAYAELAARTRDECFLPVVWGRINRETQLVLSRFGVERPSVINALDGDYRVALVDTHHPQHLPDGLDFDRVVEIIDHHPAGHPEAFAHADLQNEEVGAAATLIVERFRAAALRPSPQVAGLLAAAIISSTLNLKAPSTSYRDQRALDWLRPVVEISEPFVEEMFVALSDTAGLTTAEVLAANYKEFRTGRITIGIVQVEAIDPTAITRRADLPEELRRLAEARPDTAHVFVSIIGMLAQTTTVIAVHAATRELLIRSSGMTFTGDVALVPKILLRKTDFVPALVTLGEQEGPW